MTTTDTTAYRSRLTTERDRERRLAVEDEQLATWVAELDSTGLSEYQLGVMRTFVKKLRGGATARRQRADDAQAMLERLAQLGGNRRLERPLSPVLQEVPSRPEPAPAKATSFWDPGLVRSGAALFGDHDDDPFFND